MTVVYTMLGVSSVSLVIRFLLEKRQTLDQYSIWLCESLMVSWYTPQTPAMLQIRTSRNAIVGELPCTRPIHHECTSPTLGSETVKLF